MTFAIHPVRHPRGSRLRMAALLLVLGALPLLTLAQSAGAIVGPAITGISPSSGPFTGGTVVTITGSGFTGATSVKFGTTSVGVGSINIMENFRTRHRKFLRDKRPSGSLARRRRRVQ